MRVQLLLLTVIGVTTSCLTGCWVDNQMRYDWAGVKSFWTSDPDPQPSYAQNEPQPPAYQQGGEQGKQPQYNVASNPNGSRYSGAYNPNRNMDGLQGAPAAGPIGSQHQPQPGSYNGAGSQPIAPQQSYALPAKTGEHNSSLFNEGQARPAAAQPQPGSAPPLAAPSGAGAGNYLTPPAGQGPAVGYTPPANPQAEATPPGINGGMSQGMQGNASGGQVY